MFLSLPSIMFYDLALSNMNPKIWHSSKILSVRVMNEFELLCSVRVHEVDIILKERASYSSLTGSNYWVFSGELCGPQASYCKHYVCLLLYIVLNCSCYKFFYSYDSSLECIYSVGDAVFSTLYIYIYVILKLTVSFCVVSM